jgi:hypothetical protein
MFGFFAVMPGGHWAAHEHGAAEDPGGAVMWIAGPVQYLIAQFVVQAAWRTPYSWMVNPLSDLGAVHCRSGMQRASIRLVPGSVQHGLRLHVHTPGR